MRDEISISHEGAKRSAISMTKTLTPNSFSIVAHSTPIAPEPMINILFGNSSHFKRSSELIKSL